jgi:threonine 3-dehydrogenase
MKEGFDVGMEMSGNPQAFNAMIDHMNHAGKIALLGFLPACTAINWRQVIMKGLIIKGIYGREMFDTWYKMITMLQSGLAVEAVITHEFTAADYQQAFATMQQGQCGKVIINWSS